jgi:methylmalonyl-CoA mutase
LALRRDILVGTNQYPNLKETPITTRTSDYETLRKKRAAHIGEYRTALDNEASTVVMEKLANMLNAGPDQVIEMAIEAALAGATLGEIARTLRQGDETEVTITPLRSHRLAERFEGLRRAAEGFQAKTGSRPKVFLANMGPIPQHKPRADFSTGFFQVGGFEVIGNDGFDTVDSAAQAALASGAPIVVICSTDETYPELVPPLTQQIKAVKPDTLVILAGYPADQVNAHRAAGVDDFIHVRANVVEMLSNLQQKLGVGA